MLDIRCREGRALRALIDAHAIYGVGLDPEARPGPAGDRLSLLNGTPHRIAMPSQAFDAILAQQALSELSTPAAAVTEMHRVLKPGGRVGVADHPEALPACQSMLDAAGFDILSHTDTFLIAAKRPS